MSPLKKHGRIDEAFFRLASSWARRLQILEARLETYGKMHLADLL